MHESIGRFTKGAAKALIIGGIALFFLVTVAMCARAEEPKCLPEDKAEFLVYQQSPGAILAERLEGAEASAFLDVIQEISKRRPPGDVVLIFVHPSYPTALVLLFENGCLVAVNDAMPTPMARKLADLARQRVTS